MGRFGDAIWKKERIKVTKRLLTEKSYAVVRKEMGRQEMSPKWVTDDKQSNDSYRKVLVFIFVRFKADPYYNNTRLLSAFLYFQDLENVWLRNNTVCDSW